MNIAHTCDNKSHKQLAFPNKFKSLPIVFSTCFWLSENYTKLKETNFVTKQTCSLAESTIKSSIDLASPILNKFKDQVDHLDDLACSQLEKIENAFPIVKKEPNELLNEGKGLITSWTIQPAVDRINGIKDISGKKCTQVKNLCHKSSEYANVIDKTKIFLNKFLDLAESCVQTTTLTDEYKNLKLEANSFAVISERARLLSTILYSSIQDKLSTNANYLVQSIRQFIFSFFNLIEFCNLIKRNTCTKIQDKLHVTKDKIDLYKEYLDLLKKQFTVQDGRSLEHIHSLEERTKIIVRRNIGNLITIYRILNAKFETIRPIIEQNRVFQLTCRIASDMFHLINKPDGSIVDLINSLVVECSQAINRIENIKKSMTSLNSSLLQWVVPNFDAFGVLDELEDDDFNELRMYEPKSSNTVDLLLMDKLERYRTLFPTNNDYLDSHFRPIQMYETTSYTPTSKPNSPAECSTCSSPNNVETSSSF